MSQSEEFNSYREKMNERIFDQNHKNLNRFFALDASTYKDGALDVRTKELLGLVASMVLRCDDCIKYHIGTSFKIGITKDELFDVFMIANLVGGSICIPHTRRALEYWESLEEESK
jgi:AhpD family alkylhydroperoxidase